MISCKSKIKIHSQALDGRPAVLMIGWWLKVHKWWKSGLTRASSSHLSWFCSSLMWKSQVLPAKEIRGRISLSFNESSHPKVFSVIFSADKPESSWENSPWNAGKCCRVSTAFVEINDQKQKKQKEESENYYFPIFNNKTEKDSNCGRWKSFCCHLFDYSCLM